MFHRVPSARSGIASDRFAGSDNEIACRRRSSRLSVAEIQVIILKMGFHSDGTSGEACVSQQNDRIDGEGGESEKEQKERRSSPLLQSTPGRFEQSAKNDDENRWPHATCNTRVPIPGAEPGRTGLRMWTSFLLFPAASLLLLYC